MNIRSISNPAQVLAKDKIDSQKGIKFDETDEREANGQQPQGGDDFYRSLTPEELEQVLEKIKSNEGIQKNGLVVNAIQELNQNIVKIETPDGKVLRRFVEKDLYQYLFKGTDETLQLVKKIA